ncbi:MAG: (cytosine-5)-methyltransferase 1 [Frankiaceae bacterium]|nr:(cytosine-5)-methyltransferase 1 [Frankiaceae bacterium]
MLTLPPLADRPLTADERDAVLERVDEILELTYRSASLGNFDDPLEEAVYIILSKQTREVGYQRAHRELRARWRTWRDLMQAPLEDVIEVIKPAGFGRQRSTQLQALLRKVAADCQERGLTRITLDWLRALPDAEVERYLTSLPGIGHKSARCIMHYSLDREAFAVDTHVRRVLDRLRIVRDRGEKVKHGEYEAVVPPRLRQRLHVNLIHHGRAFCRSEQPKCGECPLISFCSTGRAIQAAPKGRPVAVELFAGGGGLGEGFSAAGFFIAIAVEKDRDAAQTYRVNHPGTVVLEADAMKLKAADLVWLAPAAEQATTVIAGPPCQGYSVAGKRQANDKRNRLYRAVVRIADQLHVRFVAIENVPGMRKVEGHSYSSTVRTALRRAGYATEYHLLRACDYGVPQLRHRLVFLGQRKSLGDAPLPPRPTHCAGRHCSFGCDDEVGSKCGRPATPTVHDALDGMPQLDHGQIAEYVELGPGRLPLLNGSTMAHSDDVKQKIASITPGSGPISYRRLHDDLARTIVAGHRALPVHPVLDRTISVREAARIQGFRDDHVFAGPRSRQPLQVANAVPPPLGRAIAEALLKEAATETKPATRSKDGLASQPHAIPVLRHEQRQRPSETPAPIAQPRTEHAISL